MIFIDAKDFYEKAASCCHMTRAEEIECAKRMKNGDTDSREQLIQSYIPIMAAHIKQTSSKPNLGLILYCQQALEKAVDSFDFLQDNVSFSHYLSHFLRHASTKYLVR